MLYLFTRDAFKTKGGLIDIINSILFGKYKVLSLLGTGSFGTVYLSKHQILECYRAIKLLPKQGAIDSLLQEAQLLKSLHHPGIPIIYDIEQDDNFVYLVEEYVEGESLEEFLLQQSHISQSVFLDLILQLCDIFLYLHTREPNPILYLDLKPEHIILCGMQVKLIDFNVATFLSNRGNIFNLFGNKEFSAPELFDGCAPTFLSDIYSLGKIMQFLSRFLDAPLNPKIHQIIKKATNADPSCRFETVDKLISAIQKQKNSMSFKPSRKKIAVVGSHPGCGSTHISIALVSTLNYMGYDSVYYQKSQTDNLQSLTEFYPNAKEKNGLLYYKFFKGLPNYGSGISIPAPEEQFIIYDYGTTFPTDAYGYDLILYICSNAPWHRRVNLMAMNSLHCLDRPLKVICNMGQKKTLHWLTKQFSLPVFHYPYDTDVFSINQQKINFVSQLLNIKRRKALFFHLLLKEVFFPRKF